MNLGKKTEKQPVLAAIILAQLVNLIALFLSLFNTSGNQTISVLNYFIMTLSTFIMVRAVLKNHLKLSVVQVLFFIWLAYLYVTAGPEIINPYRNHLHLKQFLTTILFLYAIPILMVADLNLDFWRRLLKFSYILLLFYLFTVVAFGGIKLESCTMLAEGVIILMMTWPYHKSRKRMVIVLTLGIIIVGMMLIARRNKVVFFGGGLMLALIINILSNNSYGVARKVALVLLVSSFGFGLYFAQSSFGFFFERMATGMDSREKIIELFIDDFNTHPSDWIWGRGLYGQFDGGILNTDDDLELRGGIENGYLYLILKGGGIWLGLLTLIALNAIYKGLFKSKNLFCKGCAMIILLYYLDMIGFGIPQTSMKYIMVFISIAGCNTEWLRNCSDEYLTQEIGLK